MFQKYSDVFGTRVSAFFNLGYVSVDGSRFESAFSLPDLIGHDKK